MFSLHPQLEKDTVVLGRFPLSLVLLSRDANYPWCILVPRREAMREIHHLGDEDRMQLMRESCHLAEVMVDLFVPDKMNVAVLGNRVEQLHMHHVARFASDPAWPGPVWGAVEGKSYARGELDELVGRLQSALAGEDFEKVWREDGAG
ncbi:HIT domain-containing protein [Proteobacteria bacterium 005FR1]|nr:HIT domain-containing protein [Proteobacteria bacterium 005FR1]